MSFFTNPSQRPTLPPLHTLNLPNPMKLKPGFQGAQSSHDSYDNLTCSRLGSHHWQHARQLSISSSMTSRSPSPTPTASTFSCSSSAPIRSGKLRLVPCPLETADAVVLIAPPDAPCIPNPWSTESRKRGQGLLLVGPALQHVRHPGRRLAKGARLHPYKILRSDSSRRISGSSTSSTVSA